MGGEVEVYRESNMETYFTICKIANRNLLYGSGNSNGALYQPRGVGWGVRWEGGSKGRGYMYTYGCFMLRFDRKQQKLVKQLSFNK